MNFPKTRYFKATGNFKAEGRIYLKDKIYPAYLMEDTPGMVKQHDFTIYRLKMASSTLATICLMNCHMSGT